jgi:hypothetical protein
MSLFRRQHRVNGFVARANSGRDAQALAIARQITYDCGVIAS